LAERNRLQPLFKGLGLPDIELTLQFVLSTIKDGVVLRRYMTETKFSPYNAGILLPILNTYGTQYAALKDRIFARMHEGLSQHFPDAEGRSLSEWAQMPIIGTSRVLQAYVALGRSAKPEFRNALQWVLSKQNQDGGFGLSEGDQSRMFSTSVVTELLTSIGGYPEQLRKITQFVMETYDEATGSWGVHAGKKPEAGSPCRSPSALAVQTWRQLRLGGSLDDVKSREFETVIAAVTRTLAEGIEACVQPESGSIDLHTIQPIALFHFTLVETLTALLGAGFPPWNHYSFRGLRLLAGLQGAQGQFRFGSGGDEVIWAAVEALRLLRKIEERFDNDLEGFGREIAAKFVPAGAVSGLAATRDENQFKLDAREFCAQQLIPQLKLTMASYDRDDFFLIAERGLPLLRRKVRVWLEYTTGELQELVVPKWIALAERERKSLLLVLTNKVVDVKLRRAIWMHNKKSSSRIDIYVI